MLSLSPQTCSCPLCSFAFITGMKKAFATRLCGSSDLYQTNERKPYHSINFVIAHDGFSLHDLVVRCLLHLLSSLIRSVYSFVCVNSQAQSGKPQAPLLAQRKASTRIIPFRFPCFCPGLQRQAQRHQRRRQPRREQ